MKKRKSDDVEIIEYYQPGKTLGVYEHRQIADKTMTNQYNIHERVIGIMPDDETVDPGRQSEGTSEGESGENLTKLATLLALNTVLESEEKNPEKLNQILNILDIKIDSADDELETIKNNYRYDSLRNKNKKRDRNSTKESTKSSKTDTSEMSEIDIIKASYMRNDELTGPPAGTHQRHNSLFYTVSAKEIQASKVKTDSIDENKREARNDRRFTIDEINKASDLKVKKTTKSEALDNNKDDEFEEQFKNDINDIKTMYSRGRSPKNSPKDSSFDSEIDVLA